ncbi:DMT family transporter [Pelistega sp. MC2]|uniref:DMT family transporter n=1 Tax=Pelistega sp. MC2 TaxID=1720297 RepID=UPI0008DA68A4|nr:DMT family transporter [Pelistega sp. MC2]
MKTSQPVVGFILTLIVILLWGTLPIILQPILAYMDTQTVIWYRFLVAAVGLFLLLSFSHRLPRKNQFFKEDIKWIILAIIGLAANFYLFNHSLNYVPASASQVISPLTSFFMIIVGIFVFKESMSLYQKIGLVFVLIGLPIFFNDKLATFTHLDKYSFGILLSTMASLIWVLYGIAQRILLRHFTAQQILLFIYIGCFIAYTPFTSPAEIFNVPMFAMIALGYACVNTILAYGCYAEALNRWDISKVSMLMPLIPIVTIICAYLFSGMFPDYFKSPQLNSLSVLGAIIVVMGSFISALGNILFSQRSKRQPHIKT